MWNVKEAVAHQALAERPAGQRLVLPARREAWAGAQADALIEGLRGAAYDVLGDLGELRPAGTAQPPASPADTPPELILSAAVHAASALVVNQYHKAYPAARPQPAEGGPRGLVGRVESTVASSPRIKRTVRELSSRSPAVRRLRILAWRTLERRRAAERS
jgi:hypothetical protein